MRRRREVSGLMMAGVIALAAAGTPAAAQMPGNSGGMQRPSQMSQPSSDQAPAADKPEAAARKAYAAGLKSLNKARSYESTATAAPNADKRADAYEKMSDAYNRALDQFTEALSNKGDMVDAWNNVGYIHLRLGAYTEALDDYNHTLALKPDLAEAVLHRGEAYLATDHLEDAKAAYMDLFNHERAMADQLMTTMQKWLAEHRANANGMRASDVDSFDKWLQERDGIAKQTASLPR